MTPIKKDTIFVSVASYRDDVCNTTLKSIYENASNPNNIFVGICQQNKDGDPDCLMGFENNPNIKIIRIPYTEAKGPTYARYICSTLWDGEEYFMQIDSHTKFVKGWDTKCIDMIKRIKSTGLSMKPILSHYPKEIKHYKENNDKYRHSVPRMCKSFFNSRDMLSFMGAEILDTKDDFYNTPYIAAGMMFSEAYFLNELPFDPELPYLFVGEEILHSIRFYTHGWDIFTPSENVIYHEYTRADKPKIWTDQKYSDQDAFEKVKYYIGLVDNDSKVPEYLKPNMNKYGLGNVRTLQDYYNFAGIDTQNRLVRKNFCKKDNQATEDDILKSNEKNNKKNKDKDKNIIENYAAPPPNKNGFIFGLSIQTFIIILVVTIIILYLCIFLMKKYRTKKY
jgi:hypothetical protein